MKRVCVFCGSNAGAKPEYVDAARALGRALVAAGLGLVYGGSSVGLMRALADATLDVGGEVIGVIPRLLVHKERAYERVADLHIVESMHERKALMAELADGFVAMPGGMGTLEEIFEMLTWVQLGIHDKPCGFLNVDGYYSKLFAFLDHAVAQQFIRPQHRSMISLENDPQTLIQRLVDQAGAAPAARSGHRNSTG